jgi:hypothetical protein
VLGALAYGRSESPWVWLLIVVGGMVLYVVERARGFPQAKSWADVSDRLFMVGVPWQIRALYLAMIGGGSLYHLATGSYRWYWWLLPLVAWFAFAEVMVTRGKG